METYLPFVTVLLLLVFVGVTLYFLATCLRSTVNQVTRMNEQLMIMVGVKQEGEATSRALVAHTREKQRNLQGIATVEEVPAGYTETVGGI
jgi:hypothetical protein